MPDAGLASGEMDAGYLLILDTGCWIVKKPLT